MIDSMKGQPIALKTPSIQLGMCHGMTTISVKMITVLTRYRPIVFDFIYD